MQSLFCLLPEKVDQQIWLLGRAFEHSSGTGKAMLKLRIDRCITSVGYV